MFAKNPKRTTYDDAGVPTIVDSQMTVKGNFTSGGELHVSGKIEGDVEVKTLTVGKDAVIHAATLHKPAGGRSPPGPAIFSVIAAGRLRTSATQYHFLLASVPPNNPTRLSSTAQSSS